MYLGFKIFISTPDFNSSNGLTTELKDATTHQRNGVLYTLFDKESGDPDLLNPYIIVLEIKDLLGSFGINSILYVKYKCTIYDEALPTKLTDYILGMKTRRKELIW
jgi:hypothetical protein